MKSYTPNSIVVLLDKELLQQGGDYTIKMDTDESFHLNGSITSRIAQQQAIGGIIAVLRGFQTLCCHGFIKFIAGGTMQYTGTITTFSDQHLEEAEKMVREARRQTEQFISKYLNSSFEITCAIKMNLPQQ